MTDSVDVNITVYASKLICLCTENHDKTMLYYRIHTGDGKHVATIFPPIIWDENNKMIRPPISIEVEPYLPPADTTSEPATSETETV